MIIKKVWIISIFIVIVLFLITQISSLKFSKDTTLIEVAENSTYFEEGKPFLVESITSGTIAYRYRKEDGGRRLSESEVKELIDILATTKVKKTSKSMADRRYYYVTLDNTNYTMSYDLRIFFMLQINEDTSEVIISADFSDSNYVTHDLRFYNKLVELIDN